MDRHGVTSTSALTGPTSLLHRMISVVIHPCPTIGPTHSESKERLICTGRILRTNECMYCKTIFPAITKPILRWLPLPFIPEVRCRGWCHDKTGSLRKLNGRCTGQTVRFAGNDSRNRGDQFLRLGVRHIEWICQPLQYHFHSRFNLFYNVTIQASMVPCMKCKLAFLALYAIYGDNPICIRMEIGFFSPSSTGSGLA